jgi:hypothetical protein
MKLDPTPVRKVAPLHRSAMSARDFFRLQRSQRMDAGRVSSATTMK